MTTLIRRDFNLGEVQPVNNAANDPLDHWQIGRPVVLRQQCKGELEQQQASIGQTEDFVTKVLEGDDCDSLLSNPPYQHRLDGHFQSLGSAFNEGDEQEIEMVLFDAVDGDAVVAEDLWMKISWLSFHDDDASIRFRFSFGVDHEEDVAADAHRQRLAAELSDAIFPEAAVITQNQNLISQLQNLLGKNDIKFVERILYFNAPNGGAYLHHDLERGHAGVVFAQLSGATYWLALPKASLVAEIIEFAQHHPWPDSLTPAMISELSELVEDPTQLAKQLDSFANDALIHLINETESFVQFLIKQGHGRALIAGDVILLPQANPETCCWHSVFCLGDEIGQALSFAIR